MRFFGAEHKSMFFLISLLAIFLSTGKAGPFQTPAGRFSTDTLPDYFDQTYLRYSDYTYQTGIRSVQLHPVGQSLLDPVMRLESADRLLLSFDDLHMEGEDYQYTFIHCSWDWKPSPLEVYDFLEGFPENRIRDQRASVNTLVSYQHFSLVFPNEDIRLKVSGNFLLVVFRNGNRDDLVLTRRFMVLDTQVGIKALIRQATLADQRKSSQEIDLIIQAGLSLTDPYQEIRVVIRQNGRWDNANAALRPIMVKGSELVYDYFEENVFPGGSEFRYFNCKSHRVPSDRIAAIRFSEGCFHFDLVHDEIRTFKRYIYNRDINGRFRHDVEGENDPDIEADYVWVHFFVPASQRFPNGDVFVSGLLADWGMGSENRMVYNEKRKGYTCSLFLKQGYYDYQFLFVSDEDQKGDMGIIEGNHYETENEYQIHVYHLSPSSRYNRLVGFSLVRSVNSGNQ